MPIGRVKWFDPDKGFGFVTNPGDDDVFVGTQVLPDGVEELHQGQKIEYEFAAGRKGPQVLRITDIQETGRPRRRPSHKYKPDQLQSMIQDLMSRVSKRDATQGGKKAVRWLRSSALWPGNLMLNKLEAWGGAQP